MLLFVSFPCLFYRLHLFEKCCLKYVDFRGVPMSAFFAVDRKARKIVTAKLILLKLNCTSGQMAVCRYTTYN